MCRSADGSLAHPIASPESSAHRRSPIPNNHNLIRARQLTTCYPLKRPRDRRRGRFDFMGSASPFRDHSTPFVLPPGSTPYRRPVIFGRAVAVYFALQSPNTWPPHAFPWLKIALHLGLADCEITYSLDGEYRAASLRGNQVCFFGAQESHTIHWKSEAPMIWIFVDGEYIQQLGFSSVTGVSFVELESLIRRDLSLFRIAELFHEACLKQEALIRLYVEAKATLLATRLLRAHFGSPAPVNDAGIGLNAAAFQKVTEYVRVKLAVPESRKRHLPAPASREELSNRALARVAGQSEHHFIRQFKVRTLKTPQEFVMQCRLDKAEELIVTQHYSPKEAAYAAGFCDPGHFYRRFKKRYGQSPHDLLKQRRA